MDTSRKVLHDKPMAQPVPPASTRAREKISMRISVAVVSMLVRAVDIPVDLVKPLEVRAMAWGYVELEEVQY